MAGEWLALALIVSGWVLLLYGLYGVTLLGRRWRAWQLRNRRARRWRTWNIS